MSKRFGAMVTVVLLLGGAACSSSGGTPLSKAEFTKQANAICTRVNKQVDSVTGGNLKTASPSEQADALDKFVGYGSQATKDLEDLKPPKDIADDVKTAVDLQKQGIDKVKALSDEVRAGKQVSKSSSDEVDQIGNRANAAWDKAGIKKCGSESSS